MPPPLHFNVIYLGSNVHFTATFIDANGNPSMPPSAELNIVYPVKGGGEKSVSMPMMAGTPWVADWVASQSPPTNAAPGTVYWSVESGGAQPIVRDGQFILSANQANLALDT